MEFGHEVHLWRTDGYCRSGKHPRVIINTVKRPTMNHAHEKAWVATPILLRFGAPENGISTPRAGFTPVTMTQRYVTSIFLDDSQTPPNPGFLLYELLVHVPYRYWILSLIRTGAGYHVPNGLFIFRKTRAEKHKNKKIKMHLCPLIFTRDCRHWKGGERNVGPHTNNMGTYSTRELEYGTIQRPVHRCVPSCH